MGASWRLDSDAIARLGRNFVDDSKNTSTSNLDENLVNIQASLSLRTDDGVPETINKVFGRVGIRSGRLSSAGRMRSQIRQLEDDYEMEGRALGSGYNGQVLAALHRVSGYLVAVKTFKLQSVDTQKLKEFAAETEIYLSIDHPHIARLMAVYQTTHEISLVMERCAGGTLMDRVRKQGRFVEADAAHATSQMLLAVNYLHSNGVVHRDLTCDNFLYDQEDGDFLKLIDFGFSKFFHDERPMNDKLGTPIYMSPEVIAGKYSCGSCDLWNLGVMVFIMLSGNMPFAAASRSELCWSIRKGHYRMRPSTWDRVSPKGVDFVKRLLVVNPERRMTAEEALEHPWIQHHRSLRSGDGGERLPRQPDVGEAFVKLASASRFRQVCMQISAWTLPVEEHQQLREAFLALQAEPLGVIPQERLAGVLMEHGRVSEEEAQLVVETVCEDLGADSEGGVRYSDFLAAMASDQLATNDQALRETFRCFDVEDEGFLTPQRLKVTLGDAVSDEDLEHVMAQVDTEEPGRISLPEFIAYIRSDTAGDTSLGGLQKKRERLRTSRERASTGTASNRSSASSGSRASPAGKEKVHWMRRLSSGLLRRSTSSSDSAISPSFCVCNSSRAPESPMHAKR